MQSVFLEAEWRKLVLVNYAIDKSVLTSYIPPNTELDIWNNTCYVSLVGFMFLNTKVKGVKIPFHVNFEEVNLRFYVKYKENSVYKRGVVFIKEIVPKPAITLIANTLFNENYQTIPTKHEWKANNTSFEIMYGFKKENWQTLEVVTGKEKQAIMSDSEAEFITEHYWGYTKTKNNKTTEYAVEHPRWETYPVINYKINVDFETIYGKEFSFLTGQKPVSVMLAEGSEIIVRSGKVL